MKKQITSTDEFVEALVKGRKLCGEFYKENEYFYMEKYCLMDENDTEHAVSLAEIMELFYQGAPFFFYDEKVALETDDEFLKWKQSVSSGDLCGPCAENQPVNEQHPSHCCNADLDSCLIKCAWNFQQKKIDELKEYKWKYESLCK